VQSSPRLRLIQAIEARRRAWSGGTATSLLRTPLAQPGTLRIGCGQVLCGQQRQGEGGSRFALRIAKAVGVCVPLPHSPRQGHLLGRRGLQRGQADGFAGFEHQGVDGGCVDTMLAAPLKSLVLFTRNNNVAMAEVDFSLNSSATLLLAVARRATRAP